MSEVSQKITEKFEKFKGSIGSLPAEKLREIVDKLGDIYQENPQEATRLAEYLATIKSDYENDEDIVTHYLAESPALKFFPGAQKTLVQTTGRTLAKQQGNLCKEAQIALAESEDVKTNLNLIFDGLCEEAQIILARLKNGKIVDRLIKNSIGEDGITSLCEEAQFILFSDNAKTLYKLTSDDAPVRLFKSIKDFSPRIQLVLAGRGDVWIQSKLLEKDTTLTEEAQLILADIHSSYVRQELAESRLLTSEKAIRVLAEHWDCDMKEAVFAQRPRLESIELGPLLDELEARESQALQYLQALGYNLDGPA